MKQSNKFFVSALIVAPVLMLGACATYVNVDKVASMPDKGDAFAAALHKEYVERAKFEVGEENWESVSYFLSHAEKAALGTPPALQKPADRNLKKDVKEIEAAYGQLSAALATNAPQVAPVACAQAQTWFEHWMEQAEEGHQPDDIAWTRGEYEKVVPKCVGKPMVTATYEIYFDHDSAALDAEAKAAIAKVVAAVKADKPANVYVHGYTDTTGSSAYNEALALKRAKAVAAALKASGVSANLLPKEHGEMDLKVKTGDNVNERMNRRVQVIFEK